MGDERIAPDTVGARRMAAGAAGAIGGDAATAAGAADATAEAATAANAGIDSAGPAISTEPSRDTDEADPEEVTEPPLVGDQEFGLAVDVIYHRARAAWFAAQHRVFLFGTIMAGSAAATDIANAKACALLAAALGTLDLVFDPTSRMVEHRDSARDTLAIVADLHRNDFSEEACRRAKEEEFRLSANETAPFNVLRTMAFNQAVTAFGRPEENRVWVPWERRWLANVLRFEGWQDANRERLAWAKHQFRRLGRSMPI